MREIQGDQPPPGPSGPAVMVRWPRPDAPLYVVLLSDCPIGQNLHSVPSGPAGAHVTRACLRPGECPHCLAGTPAAWRCYLAAWDLESRRPVAIPYTRSAWGELCRAAVGDEPLRGMAVRIRRAHNLPQGAYLITRVECPIRSRDLPTEPDILPALESALGRPPLRRRCAAVSDVNGGAE